MAKRVKSPSGRALYPVLPRGSHGIPADRVALNQRARLQGAMVAAVAQSGYGKVTIKQLVSLAGVSRSSFYKHFADKEQCFLATYDVIAAIATENIERSYRAHDDWQERLTAAFTTFAEGIVDERDASHLVLIDALGVGPRVLEHRERLTAAFERLFRQSFDSAPERARVTDTTIKAIVAGIRRVAHRRLLRDEPEQLRGLIPDLMEWALDYHAPGVKPPQRRAVPASKPLQQTLEDNSIAPLDPAEARRTLSHRTRILHAVVSITSERGYAALSIPAISKTAGISNVAFYENFTDKDDALLSAFDEAIQRALKHVGKAFVAAPTWTDAAHATLKALLEFIAEDPIFARLAFFDILAGGPAAIEKAEQGLDTFETMLEPAFQAYPDVPEVVGEAIIGGLWNVIQHEVGHGRAAQLPDLTDELTYIVVTPFLGAKEAADLARTNKRKRSSPQARGHADKPRSRVKRST
jgi:AcrR family transcriptional regulator